MMEHSSPRKEEKENVVTIVKSSLIGLIAYIGFVDYAKNGGANKIKPIQFNDTGVYCSLLVGAIIPYAFSA